MALEARDLGIDSCIVTPDQDVVKKILRVRKEDAVPLLIGFGYQYHKAFQKERVRRKLSETTSFEYFGGKMNKTNLKKKIVSEFLKIKSKKGIYTFISKAEDYSAVNQEIMLFLTKNQKSSGDLRYIKQIPLSSGKRT